MRSWTIAFLIGHLCLLLERELPDPFWLQLLPLAPVSLLAGGAGRLAHAAITGYLLAALAAHLATGAWLPGALEGVDLEVEGTVEGVPARDARRARLVLDVKRAVLAGAASPSPVPFGGRVRLSWYGVEPGDAPRGAERWRLRVRLRAPRGFSNPGGFDYEAWLLARRIAATGYVRPDPRNARLAPARPGLSGLRQSLAEAVARALEGHEFSAMVAALGLGVRADLEPAQWEVLRRTGTAHLMAISGLHVGMVAGAAFWLGTAGWRRSSRLLRLAPAPRVGAAVALLAAALYAALSGFAVPAQRALIMSGVLAMGAAFGLRSSPGRILCAALVAVLLLDPLAPLAGGFWLSFAAVALILGYMARRPSTGPGSASGPGGRARTALRLQFLLTLGLAPLTAALFQGQPLVAPVANLLAIPWVGLVVVPLVFAGLALVLPVPAAGGWVLGLAGDALAVLWAPLELLAGPDLSWRPLTEPGLAALAFAAVGIALALLPARLPGRWLAPFWLAPLLLAPAPRVAPGELRVTALDVGQGLAVVLETARHVLVYDTGPPLGPDLDGVRVAVTPYLRSRGWPRIDLAVLSHHHLDHAGGVESLLSAWPGTPVLTNVELPGGRGEPCRSGRSWAWDGVRFEVLHPAVAVAPRDNDDSCVLRVDAAGGGVLLPADIEAGAEGTLVQRLGAALRADVLLVPHHGSRTSSGEAFLDAVQPRVAVVSRGHRNRFRLPHPEVVARYRSRPLRWLDTARDGAVSVHLHPVRGVGEPAAHRRVAGRFWRAP